MNIFILNSGRCGSSTFIAACRHIDNYSCGHESRATALGSARFDYPDNHIEADNRLSWLLGRLDRHYGQQPFYIHLQRNREASAASFAKREQLPLGIIPAYRNGILMGASPAATALAISDDYLDTVESNIKLFLKDKPKQMPFWLERAADDFKRFWHAIGAEGDFEAAVAEWQIRHNAS
ncbi:hypothetical protein D5085_03045 [Ectothiorhodospiraceae bacterium BW-2]|nr:hypothetical protein D5085_03045 [Ectothiorhodospiraceae bacterium BW-2]